MRQSLLAAGFLSAASAWAALGAEPGAPPAGPWVEVTLRAGAEKIAGQMLDFRNGQLRIRPEGSSSEKTLEAAQVESINFERPPAPPEAGAEPAEAPAAKSEGPPWKKDVDRPGLDERRPPPGLKWRNFFRKRIEERLTPEEQTRFAELMVKLRRDPKELTPAELDDLRRMQKKLGMLESDLFRRLVGEALKAALQARAEGRLHQHVQSHREALRAADTEEDKRRHVAALFAAAYLERSPQEVFIKEVAEALARPLLPAKKDLAVQALLPELEAFYEVFQEEADKPLIKGPRAPP
jgi:hypothetical protein